AARASLPRLPQETDPSRARCALRLEDLQLRARDAPDRRRLARVQLEHQSARAGAHLEGRLHHPRALPRHDHARLRAQTHACEPTARPRVQRATAPLAKRLATRRDDRATPRHPRARDGRRAQLLRQLSHGRPAAESDPGAARLLRRAHLRARTPLPEVEPSVLVIFGASGDLAKRKLIPALYDLFHAGCLKRNFAVLGVGQAPWSDDEFRTTMHEGTSKSEDVDAFDEGKWQEFAQHLTYMTGDLTADATYAEIAARTEKLHAQIAPDGAQHRLFYFSTPPSLAPAIAKHL